MACLAGMNHDDAFVRDHILADILAVIAAAHLHDHQNLAKLPVNLNVA